MDNKQGRKNQELDNYMVEGIPLGMCFGVCIGVVVGIFLDNVPICMTFGIAIGMTVGMGVGSLIKKTIVKVNNKVIK